MWGRWGEVVWVFGISAVHAAVHVQQQRGCQAITHPLPTPPLPATWCWSLLRRQASQPHLLANIPAVTWAATRRPHTPPALCEHCKGAHSTAGSPAAARAGAPAWRSHTADRSSGPARIRCIPPTHLQHRHLLRRRQRQQGRAVRLAAAQVQHIHDAPHALYVAQEQVAAPPVRTGVW